MAKPRTRAWRSQLPHHDDCDPKSGNGSFYYLIIKSSGCQPASIVGGQGGFKRWSERGLPLDGQGLNAMPGNVSCIPGREHGRVVCQGGSWLILHGSHGEDGMREQDLWSGAQVGGGSGAPGGKRRDLAGMVTSGRERRKCIQTGSLCDV